jgi:hypothetical protein
MPRAGCRCHNHYGADHHAMGQARSHRPTGHRLDACVTGNPLKSQEGTGILGATLGFFMDEMRRTAPKVTATMASSGVRDSGRHRLLGNVGRCRARRSRLRPGVPGSLPFRRLVARGAWADEAVRALGGAVRWAVCTGSSTCGRVRDDERRATPRRNHVKEERRNQMKRSPRQANTRRPTPPVPMSPQASAGSVVRPWRSVVTRRWCNPKSRAGSNRAWRHRGMPSDSTRGRERASSARARTCRPGLAERLSAEHEAGAAARRRGAGSALSRGSGAC